MGSQRENFWVEIWVIHPPGIWWYDVPEELKFKIKDEAAAKMAAEMLQAELVKICKMDLKHVKWIKARIKEDHGYN